MLSLNSIFSHNTIKLATNFSINEKLPIENFFIIYNSFTDCRKLKKNSMKIMLKRIISYMLSINRRN